MPSCDLPASLQALPALPYTRPVSGFVVEELVSALKPIVSTDTAEYPKYVKDVFITRKEILHSFPVPIPTSGRQPPFAVPGHAFLDISCQRNLQHVAFLAGLPSRRRVTSLRFICVVPGVRAF